jgi:hypothetical protein
MKDAWRTKSWKDKFRIWVMPTGWRPADVAEKYPVPYVKDMETFKKFDPSSSPGFTAWSMVQMLSTLALLCFFFSRLGHISNAETLIYGGVLLGSIFAYTAVMDKQSYGVATTVLLSALALALIIATGDWFGMKDVWGMGIIVVAAYFILSATVSICFSLTEFRAKDTATFSVEAIG